MLLMDENIIEAIEETHRTGTCHWNGLDLCLLEDGRIALQVGGEWVPFSSDAAIAEVMVASVAQGLAGAGPHDAAVQLQPPPAPAALASADLTAADPATKRSMPADSMPALVVPQTDPEQATEALEAHADDAEAAAIEPARADVGVDAAEQPTPEIVLEPSPQVEQLPQATEPPPVPLSAPPAVAADVAKPDGPGAPVASAVPMAAVESLAPVTAVDVANPAPVQPALGAYRPLDAERLYGDDLREGGPRRSRFWQAAGLAVFGLVMFALGAGAMLASDDIMQWPVVSAWLPAAMQPEHASTPVSDIQVADPETPEPVEQVAASIPEPVAEQPQPVERATAADTPAERELEAAAIAPSAPVESPVPTEPDALQDTDGSQPAEQAPQRLGAADVLAAGSPESANSILSLAIMSNNLACPEIGDWRLAGTVGDADLFAVQCAPAGNYAVLIDTRSGNSDIFTVHDCAFAAPEEVSAACE